MRKRLTQRQWCFCTEYFKSGNGTEAAILAGYSRRTARFIASENLTKPYIQEDLARLNAQIESEAVASVQERKILLSQIAMEDLQNERGIPIRSWNIQAIAELNRMEERCRYRITDQ